MIVVKSFLQFTDSYQREWQPSIDTMNPLYSQLGLVGAALYQDGHLESLPSMPHFSNLDNSHAIGQTEAVVFQNKLQHYLE